MIYFDNAATTKPKQEVIDAMMPYITEKWYNPSSLYGDGVNVRKDIEAARRTIAEFINAEPEEIYFTSGASESNNWALQGWIFNNRKNMEPSCIITTGIEHKSIESCIEGISSLNFGLTIDYTELDGNGFVKLNELEKSLNIYSEEHSCIVSIGMANNEIGTIQDIKAISTLVHKYNGVLHCDSTQALGQIPIDVKAMGIDMMSASGHKIGCVKGIGFLYIRNGVKIQPLIYGAQERGLRGGTENVAGIIGLAKAVELCNIYQDIEYTKVKSEIRDRLIDILKNEFGCKLNGDKTQRLPNNINVTFPNVTGESLLYTLDLSDCCISTGSACNSTSIEPSYVLKAIGLSDEEAMRTIRISLPDTYGYDIDEYIKIIKRFIEELKKAIKIITI